LSNQIERKITWFYTYLIDQDRLAFGLLKKTMTSTKLLFELGVRRYLSSSTAASASATTKVSTSILRNERHVPKSLPFETHLLSATTTYRNSNGNTQRYGSGAMTTGTGDITGSESTNSPQEITSKFNSDHDKVFTVGGRIKRTSTASSSEGTKNILSAYGGRLIRNDVDDQQIHVSGNSFAVTMSATARHRYDQQKADEIHVETNDVTNQMHEDERIRFGNENEVITTNDTRVETVKLDKEDETNVENDERNGETSSFNSILALFGGSVMVGGAINFGYIEPNELVSWCSEIVRF